VLGYLDKRYFQEQVFRASSFEGTTPHAQIMRISAYRRAINDASEIMRSTLLSVADSSPPCMLWCALVRSASSAVSALAARLFSAWCSITCALCLLLSRNLDNRALFVVTFFSFAVAFAFFAMEFLVYQTVDARGVWMQALVATTSLVLMYQHMQEEGVEYYMQLKF
jgi:hypothetical protein